MSLLDWEKNTDPAFRKTYICPPVPYRENEQFAERWISYANDYFSAKELTIYPGKTAVVDDPVAYGCILLQGHGEFGAYADAEAATCLRYGQAPADEYFVSEGAAKKGVCMPPTNVFWPCGHNKWYVAVVFIPRKQNRGKRVRNPAPPGSVFFHPHFAGECRRGVPTPRCLRNHYFVSSPAEGGGRHLNDPCFFIVNVFGIVKPRWNGYNRHSKQ